LARNPIGQKQFFRSAAKKDNILSHRASRKKVDSITCGDDLLITDTEPDKEREYPFWIWIGGKSIGYDTLFCPNKGPPSAPVNTKNGIRIVSFLGSAPSAHRQRAVE
jgi:hypothetical protein